MAIETLFKSPKTKENFLKEVFNHFSYFYTEAIDQYTIIFKEKHIWGHFSENEEGFIYFDVKYEGSFRENPSEIKEFIQKMEKLGVEVA